MKFDYNMIEQGDLVDFGNYGQLYVCNILDNNSFWVIDSEHERQNRSAYGWAIPKNFAKGIVESFNSVMEKYEENVIMDNIEIKKGIEEICDECGEYYVMKRIFWSLLDQLPLIWQREALRLAKQSQKNYKKL